MDSPTVGRPRSGPAARVSGFVEASYALDPERLRRGFGERLRSAPARSSPYVAERAIGGRKPNSNRAEELLAYALFTSGVRFGLPDGTAVDVVDFQTPLNARRGDGLGKLDLLGVGRGLWVIELKVLRRHDSADTPLSAALEAVDYCAVVQANIATFASELEAIDRRLSFDRVAALVLAPFDYWERWDRSPSARGWQDAVRHAATVIAEATGVRIEFGAFDPEESTPIKVSAPISAHEAPAHDLPSTRRRPQRVTARVLEAAQLQWAQRNGVPMLDAKHTADVDLNLFVPLSEIARSDIGVGGGGELDTSKGPARLSNLRSSTALAVNVFDPWIGHNLAALTTALNVGPVTRIRYEQKYPTGLGGQPPNLDVVLSDADDSVVPVAVEAKYVEPYDGQDNEFRTSYFRDDSIWKGLSTLRRLAESITDESFERLKAAQLIKHALGLARTYEPGGFTLLYLWYDHPGDAADTHRAEIARFAEQVREDIAFRSITYQELVDRLYSEPVPGYFDYLADRYDLRRR